jgi:hypothetical protein
MDDKVVNINKEASIKIIENQLELFAQAIIKKNFIIKNLRDSLENSEKERVKLARAYAEKLGILKKMRKMGENQK